MKEKRERFFSKKIVSMLLAVCLFFQATIPAEAVGEKCAFQIPVITESGSFIGDFLICDGKVYADTDTVEQMTGLEYAMVLMEEGTAGSFYDETRDIPVYDEELITYVTGKSGWYVPLSKIAGESGGYLSFRPEEKILMVKMGPDMSELMEQLQTYKMNSAYKIASWSESFLFKADKAWAVLTDMVKNFKYLSYGTGEAEIEKYREAFLKILLPQDDADISFAKETVEMVELLKTCVEIANSVSVDLVGKYEDGMLGDLQRIIDEADKLGLENTDAESYIDAIAQMRGYGDMEESCIRGLKYILEEDNKNKKMRTAGKEILEEYELQTPIWEVAGTGSDKEEKIYNLLFPKKYLCDIANLVTNQICGTQKQADATLLGISCLEIQEQCGDKYTEFKNEYYKTDQWEQRLQALEKAHNVMTVYLEAGREAYIATAIDSEMKAASEPVVEEIDNILNELAEYQSIYFDVYDQADKVEQDMIHYVESMQDNTEVIVETAKTNGLVTCNWNVDEGNLLLTVQGTTNHGESLTFSEKEKVFYKPDGAAAAFYEEEDGKTVINILDTACIWDIVIEDAEGPMNEVTPKDIVKEITVQMPGKRLVRITDNEEYYVRSYTGVWTYSFRINQAEVVPYNPFANVTW
mgnify:CR=1 FL=1